ncbi:hypothetical protein ABEB36_007407 [Hypothenemus hampei]|uniref:Uncharacterized protein n=1 Tax=Hypothenemus hampei TaxID=57062 RepID=A0ABD1ETV0_HYPHA
MHEQAVHIIQGFPNYSMFVIVCSYQFHSPRTQSQQQQIQKLNKKKLLNAFSCILALKKSRPWILNERDKKLSQDGVLNALKILKNINLRL